MNTDTEVGGGEKKVGATPLTIIGGNMLSPFYSTAFFVPANGAQSFTAISSISGTYWSVPFCRATPRRRRGLPDVTHSWYPISRGRRQTQVTYECFINMFTNPDGPAEQNLSFAGGLSGYQMYLTLGSVTNYPVVDTNQYYFWVPSVFIEEIPHPIDVMRDPVEPIKNDLIVRSNGPAFFLPTDNVGSPSPISQFCSYIQNLGWGF